MKWIKFGKWKTAPYGDRSDGEKISDRSRKACNRRKLRATKRSLYRDEDTWFVDLTSRGTTMSRGNVKRLINNLIKKAK